MLVHINTDTPDPCCIDNCLTDFHFNAQW